MFKIMYGNLLKLRTNSLRNRYPLLILALPLIYLFPKTDICCLSNHLTVNVPDEGFSETHCTYQIRYLRLYKQNLFNL